MPLNWPGSRPPSQSAAEILPPEDRADPGSYPEGRMAGYDGDPGPILPSPPRSANRWATAPATYTLVGINCAVYLADGAARCLAYQPHGSRPGALGRQFRRLCARRAVVASAHRRVCARRHSAPGDQHVVLVESRIAGRAAARSRRVVCRLCAHRHRGKFAQYRGASADCRRRRLGRGFWIGRRADPAAQGETASRASGGDSPAAQERDLLCAFELCDRGHHDVPAHQHSDRQYGPPGRVSLRSGAGRPAGTQNRRGQEPIRRSFLGSVRRHGFAAAGLRLRHRVVLALDGRLF